MTRQDSSLRGAPSFAAPEVDFSGVNLVTDRPQHSLAGTIARQRSFKAAAARAESGSAMAPETTCASLVRAARPMVTGKIDDGHDRASRILAIAESGERFVIVVAVMLAQKLQFISEATDPRFLFEEHAAQRDFNSLKFTQGHCG
jgi:hypothetical protein